MPTFDPSQPYDVISEPRVTRGSTFGDQAGPGTDLGDNGQFAYGGSSVNNPEDYAALPVGSGVPPGYQFPVLNPATGDVTWVTHRDKGPAKWTGRGVDLAPSAMAKLHAQTDDPLVVDTARAVPPFDPSKPYQIVNASQQQAQAIPSPTLSQEVGPPQAPPAATDARTQHLIDSSPVQSQRDLENIAASLPGYQQSQEAASQNDTRDKLTAAIGNNLTPIANHPLQSAYDMLVPTKENTYEPLKQMFTDPAKAFSRDVPIGSQEWYNELIANLSLVLPGAVEGVRGKFALGGEAAPKPEVKTEAAAPAPEAAPAPVAPVAGTEDFARVNTAPLPTHELTRQAIDWQGKLQGERATLERQGQIAQAVSGNMPRDITDRIAAIDAEIKAGYQPFSEPLDETTQSATIPNAKAPEAPLKPEKEPAQGAETDLAPAGTLDEGAVERPNATFVREPASMERPGEPGNGAEAGQSANSEALGVTGVSRAARDAAGEVERTPAGILSVEDHVQNGQKLEAQGADPVAVVKAAVDGKSFSRDATDLAIKRDADLTRTARQARRAADQAPGDTKLGATADAAEKAQQQWEDYAIRPIRGQFADTGMSLQTAIDLDTGDYVDYAKQFRKQNGREPTQPESVQLKQATRTARKLSEANSADLSRIEKAAKSKRIMNLDELRQSLAKTRDEALKPCPV